MVENVTLVNLGFVPGLSNTLPLTGSPTKTLTRVPGGAFISLFGEMVGVVVGVGVAGVGFLT